METLAIDESTTIDGIVNITLENVRTAERFPDLPTQVASGEIVVDDPPFFRDAFWIVLDVWRTFDGFPPNNDLHRTCGRHTFMGIINSITTSPRGVIRFW